MGSNPITLWQTERGKVEAVTCFIFLGSKMTADCDSGQEIKRCLLLRRKPMTNLDSGLKTSDINLPSKVHIVNAMIFPVVMYGCEGCTIKKVERWRIDAFEQWCWRRLSRNSWEFLDCKEIKPVHPKGNQHWRFTGRTDAEAEAPILWLFDGQWADSLEKTLMLGKTEGKRRRGWQRMRELDSITNSMEMNLSKLQETVEDRGDWHAAVHRVTKSWTQLSD